MDLTGYLASPWADVDAKRSVRGDSVRALDGIRGLAVLIVLASHTGAFGMTGQGVLGVLLFFTLSGFVLTIPFANDPKLIFRLSNILSFFANRALRILPAFAAAVLYMAWYLSEDLRWIAVHFTFSGGWNHLWSVAEEARFYALFPAVIAAIALLPSLTARIGLLIAGIALDFHYRYAAPIDSMDGFTRQFYFWFFLAGILSCLIYASIFTNGMPTVAKKLLAIVAGLTIPFVLLSSNSMMALVWRPLLPSIPSGFSLDGLNQPALWCGLYSMLLLSIATDNNSFASKLLASWPMRHLGLLSYSLYLFHIPVMALLQPLQLDGIGLFIVTLAATYPVAIVSYLFLEKPALMLKPKRTETCVQSRLKRDLLGTTEVEARRVIAG